MGAVTVGIIIAFAGAGLIAFGLFGGMMGTEASETESENRRLSPYRSAHFDLGNRRRDSHRDGGWAPRRPGSKIRASVYRSQRPRGRSRA